MADATEKWEDNVPGNVTIGGQTVSFYVDKESSSARCAPTQRPTTSG